MGMHRFLAAVAIVVAASHVATAQDWGPPRPHRRDTVQIRIGRDYHLPADRTATSTVVVLGGAATIDGVLDDDLLVLGGTVHVGPNGRVLGDVTTVAGHVELADGGQVRGTVHDIATGMRDLDVALHDWSREFGRWLRDVDSRWWTLLGLLGTLGRFAVTLLACCLVALVAPGWVRRLEQHAAGSAVPAALIGVAAQLLATPLFVLVAVALVLTIVGIPLLVLVPFAVMAFVAAWVAGFAAVAALVGRRMRQRSAAVVAGSDAIDAAWGVLALFFVTFLGNLLAFAPWWLRPFAATVAVAGFAIEYLAWTIGLGATLFVAFSRRWRPSPPPLPSPASARA